MTALGAILVVVPARDEAERIGRCADRIQRATQALRADGWDGLLRVQFVLDRCRDDTARVLHGRRGGSDPGWSTTAVGAGSPGAARALGVDLLAGQLPAGTSDHRVWVATTDADSAVPRHWLLHQLGLARAGWDAWVGTVEPDHELAPPLATAWRARHRLGDGHPHVFGANLGVRLSAYRAAGGFTSVPVGEDVDLVTELRRRNARIRADDAARVRTSGRLIGRAVDGFAAQLRRPGTPTAAEIAG